MMDERERYMALALELAREAAAAGEVPVGCVIVRDGQVVGRGRNRREEKHATASHAEMEAIAQANEALGSWRLDDCELYVTLEPCPMCAGAMVMACLDRCYFGARDARQGCCESVYALPGDPAFYHRLPCVGGLMEEEAAALLRRFFQARRSTEEGGTP